MGTAPAAVPDGMTISKAEAEATVAAEVAVTETIAEESTAEAENAED